MKRTLAVLAMSVGLAGCYYAPAVPAGPAPLVAVPGPGKSEAQFRADDAACRAAPTVPPIPAARATDTATSATPPAADPPGVAYLRCMAARDEVIEPLATAALPVVYGYYPAYPVYTGIDYGFPVFFGGYYGFGFYGRGGHFGGYRGGFYHDGFYHGGGVYRNGGGFAHGGFGHR